MKKYATVILLRKPFHSLDPSTIMPIASPIGSTAPARPKLEEL